MNVGITITGLFVGSDMKTYKRDDGSTTIRNIIAIACGIDCYQVYLADGEQLPTIALGEPVCCSVKPYLSRGNIGYGNGRIVNGI